MCSGDQLVYPCFNYNSSFSYSFIRHLKGMADLWPSVSPEAKDVQKKLTFFQGNYYLGIPEMVIIWAHRRL